MTDDPAEVNVSREIGAKADWADFSGVCSRKSLEGAPVEISALPLLSSRDCRLQSLTYQGMPIRISPTSSIGKDCAKKTMKMKPVRRASAPIIVFL